MKAKSVAAVAAQSQITDQKVDDVLKNHGKRSVDRFEKAAGKPGAVGNNGLYDTLGTLTTADLVLTTIR